VCEQLHAGEGFVPLCQTTANGSAANKLIDARRLLFASADLDALGNAVVRLDGGSFVAYSPACTLTTALPDTTGVTVIYTSAGDPILVNDVILIDNERMLVQVVVGATNTLTVVRGYAGSAAAPHGTTGVAIYNATAPLSGDFSNVIDGGLATSGEVTVSPAFASAVPSLTDFSLWHVTHPQQAERALSRVLRKLRREVLIPVSVLANPDFEVDTASWGATSCVIARVTTAARVFHGTGALFIDATGGNLIASSETIRVVEGRPWILACMGMADIGTLTLVGRDITNSADISGAASTDEEAYTELWVSSGYMTIPSGCEELVVRLQGVGATDEFYVDDVILWPAERAWFTLPSFVEDPDDFVSVGYYRYAPAAPGTHSSHADEGDWVTWPHRLKPNFIEEGGGRPFQIEMQTPIRRPLYARVRRPFADLAADADTTTADRELVVGLTMREIINELLIEAARRKDAEMSEGWTRRLREVNETAIVRAFDGRHGEQRLIVEFPRRRRRLG
jgi:hypothetical protein